MIPCVDLLRDNAETRVPNGFSAVLRHYRQSQLGPRAHPTIVSMTLPPSWQAVSFASDSEQLSRARIRPNCLEVSDENRAQSLLMTFGSVGVMRKFVYNSFRIARARPQANLRAKPI